MAGDVDGQRRMFLMNAQYDEQRDRRGAASTPHPGMMSSPRQMCKRRQSGRAGGSASLAVGPTGDPLAGDRRQRAPTHSPLGKEAASVPHPSPPHNGRNRQGHKPLGSPRNTPMLQALLSAVPPHAATAGRVRCGSPPHPSQAAPGNAAAMQLLRSRQSFPANARGAQLPSPQSRGRSQSPQRASSPPGSLMQSSSGDGLSNSGKRHSTTGTPVLTPQLSRNASPTPVNQYRATQQEMDFARLLANAQISPPQSREQSPAEREPSPPRREPSPPRTRVTVSPGRVSPGRMSPGRGASPDRPGRGQVEVPTKVAWRYGPAAQTEATINAERRLVEELAAMSKGGQLGPEDYLTALARRDQQIIGLEKRLAVAEAAALESKKMLQMSSEGSKAKVQQLEMAAEASSKQTLQAWQALEAHSRAMEVMQSALQKANGDVQCLQAELARRSAEWNAREEDHVRSKGSLQVSLQRLQALQTESTALLSAGPTGALRRSYSPQADYGPGSRRRTYSPQTDYGPGATQRAYSPQTENAPGATLRTQSPQTEYGPVVVRRTLSPQPVQAPQAFLNGNAGARDSEYPRSPEHPRSPGAVQAALQRLNGQVQVMRQRSVQREEEEEATEQILVQPWERVGASPNRPASPNRQVQMIPEPANRARSPPREWVHLSSNQVPVAADDKHLRAQWEALQQMGKPDPMLGTAGQLSMPSLPNTDVDETVTEMRQNSAIGENYDPLSVAINERGEMEKIISDQFAGQNGMDITGSLELPIGRSADVANMGDEEYAFAAKMGGNCDTRKEKAKAELEIALQDIMNLTDLS